MHPLVRIVAAWALVFMLSPLAVHAETYFGFQLGTGESPPPPTITFSKPPRIVVVPSTRVSRVTDTAFTHDLFRFGGTWYAYVSRYWYRADDINGPYRVLDARNVPRAVLFVPPMHWKHHPERIPKLPPKRSVAAGVKRTPEGRRAR